MNLQRLNCAVCNQFTMLLATENDGRVEHAQCGNANCKSNKEEEK